MRQLALTLLTLLIILALAVGAVAAYAKAHGFSAKGRPSPVEAFVADRLLELSYPASAKTAKNPLQPTPENLASGRNHFRHDCAVCHGEDGAGKTEIARGLWPKVPDLRDESDLSDGQLFYIIRNGVRFTGMPGWSDPDEEIWQDVLFIRDLHNQPSSQSSAVRTERKPE